MSKDWANVERELKDPFASQDIAWRVGATNKDKTEGIALAYITNSVIQKRLDNVFGMSNWKNDYKEWRSKGVLCGLSCRLEGDKEWITKWDGADESAIEATKGGLSDAMKRAAYQWGIGRYLKDLETCWVEVEKRGNSVVIKGGCEPRLPVWALPAGTGNAVQQRPTQGQQGSVQQGGQRPVQGQQGNPPQGTPPNGPKGGGNTPPARNNAPQGQPPVQQQGKPDIFPFVGLVELKGEPVICKKPTPSGMMDNITIRAMSRDGQVVVIEGWGVEMIEHLADLKIGQFLSIDNANARTAPNGSLRIRVTPENFQVRGAA